ncbi:unnamed protein product [Phytophthora fragariaefolia]|uniref:Unnamed protein product n=1 Tax=Phytophthora fragariaefolia TaxID=1490495 RepID=A0A9W6XWR9_9STRA|nr:unnamed protein product [Phytophthora fragariaefolia]
MWCKLRNLKMVVVLFRPQAHQIPMESGVAHVFTELGLNLLVNYPEILFNKTQKNVLTVSHQLEDPHHVFLLTDSKNKQIEHSWGLISARLAGIDSRIPSTQLLRDSWGLESDRSGRCRTRG